jgi:hypothetical protein
MTKILAHGERFDLSATVYFFDGRRRVIQRTFTLRNTEGEGLPASVEAASELMGTVAEQLHYLTAAGIDRVAIRADGRDMRELILGLPTRRPAGHFMDAVRFPIRMPHVYFWVNQRGVRRWRVAEEQLSEGWERVASNRRSKAVSFDLPCHAGSARQGAGADEPFSGPEGSSSTDGRWARSGILWERARRWRLAVRSFHGRRRGSRGC